MDKNANQAQSVAHTHIVLHLHFLAPFLSVNGALVMVRLVDICIFAVQGLPALVGLVFSQGHVTKQIGHEIYSINGNHVSILYLPMYQ